MFSVVLFNILWFYNKFFVFSPLQQCLASLCGLLHGFMWIQSFRLHAVTFLWHRRRRIHTTLRVLLLLLLLPNCLVYDLWVKHTFSKKHIQIHWKTQYVWQVHFPKTTHKITTNIKHQNQQTIGDNNENTLLTKTSAESDSTFQMKGSKTFGKNQKQNKTKK